MWITSPASVSSAYPTASGTLCGTWSGSKSMWVADHAHGARLDHVQVRGDPLLRKLLLHHRQREARPADGRVGKLAQEVVQGADVILVRVGEQHRVHLARGFEIGEVGRDHLDAERLLRVGKHQAAVDHHPVAARLHHHAVHPHLAQAAEGDDADRSGRRWHRRMVTFFAARRGKRGL